ncbi:MAG TPA: cytochrome c3 family protein, partial [Bryobacteraceae bacterium]|nr:cytochrome c3 family protein [Bryobacteraceae bacterium]
PFSIFNFVTASGWFRGFRGRSHGPGARFAPVLGGLVFAGLFAVVQPAFSVDQPIAFPHKKHIAIGLQCLDCHSQADTGPAATIPSVQKCMLCHAKIATDKPEVKKVAEYAKKGREIPWVRVYKFEPHADVRFNHAAHIRAKVDCATCHGDMTQALTAQKNVNHNMGTCVTCHRQKGAPQDCATCHY